MRTFFIRSLARWEITMRFLCFILAFISILISNSAFADTRELNTDRPGGDYKHFFIEVEPGEVCENACVRDARCKAWTLVKKGIQGPQAQCWLKSSVPPPRQSDCCLSGTKGQPLD
jgi:PAN domain-containing protein